MTGKKVIFIGGSSFSGSTLLDMMLSSGKEGFSAGEVIALFRPYRLHHINPACGCDDSSCILWKEIKEKGVKNVYLELFERFPGISYIVDSSKEPFWINEQTKHLKRNGVDVEQVLIWKTPLEFALSRLKRRKIKGWKKKWKNYYKRYFSTIERCVSVKFSDLATKPEETLKRLCRNIGIEYFNDKEKYWEYKHHILFGNASAKIHLYAKNSVGYKTYNEEVEETIGQNYKNNLRQNQHRTIYYDNDFKKKLPIDVIKDAENDRELAIITNILEALDTGLSYHESKTLEIASSIRLPISVISLLKTRYFIINTLNRIKLSKSL